MIFSRDRISVLLVFCALLFVFVPASAQEQYRFRYFNKEDGVSQSSVFAIEQDATGFLWFGTRDGLNKYDGYDFTIFRTTEGLVNNDVRAILHDSTTNILWVGTLGGLSKYDISKEQFTSYRFHDGSGLNSNSIRFIKRGKAGRLWVGTSVGLNYLDEKNNQFLEVKSAKLPLEVMDMLISSNGVVYLGTNKGLFTLSKGESNEPEITLVSGLLSSDRFYINTLIEARDGSIWLGTEGMGVIRWEPATDSFRQFKSIENKKGSLNHNRVRSIIQDKAGNIWVGTFRGLNKITASGECCDAMPEDEYGPGGIRNGSIRDLYIDQRGALWVGTYHGGLAYYEPGLNQFKSYYQRPLRNSLSSDVVSSFQEDEANNLWIGTEGGGLNKLNRATGRFEVFRHREGNNNSLSGDNIKTLLHDNKNIWIGTYGNGLDRMDLQTGAFIHFRHQPGNPQSISTNDVYDLLQEGDSLWIACYGGGLNLYDTKKKTFEHFRSGDHPGSLTSDLSRVIVRDDNGTLWVGTQHGLNESVPGKQLLFKPHLKEKSIFSLYPDTKGKIWVGTYSNGLFSIDVDSGKQEHFTTKEGLPGNSIFGILADEAGDLWLSTNNGLARFEIDNHRITSYDQSHGLRALEYNFNAYHRLRNGEMLFGGIRGFTLFNPEAITSNTFAPPVVFTGMRQFDKPVPVTPDGLLTTQLDRTKKIEFPYNGASFSISFAALDFFNPDDNEYRYKLEGLDQNWTSSKGKTSANYTIQRPGSYLFRLRAANSEDVWNPVERQLEITVHPPPWRSWWAYTIYCLLFIAALYALYHFLKLRQQYKFDHLANEQRETLNQAKLRFFTNVAHEFRTPLTLILGPLEEIIHHGDPGGETAKKLRIVKQSASRLLDLVNQLLTFRKLEAEGEQLAAGPGNIVKFCREIHLSFSEHARLRNIHFTFEAAASEIELYFDRDKLEKVLVNLLANAFKFTPDGGNIGISLSIEGTNLNIQVRDSGVGIPDNLREQIFKRFYEKEGNVRNILKGSGIGLALSREMIALHKGSIQVQSEVDKGSIFTIILPLGKKHLRPSDIIANFKDSEQIDNYRSLAKEKAAHLPLPVEETLTFSALAVNGKLLNLLIVEDNPAVREYIEDCFRGLFNITSTENGVMGFMAAIKNPPDLIISDVMMPEMDGITLCGKLKKDARTSHVPIILLTARTAATFKLEGLETGADDYVTKPFSPRELRLRARNILLSRLKIRDKLVRLGMLEPKEIQLTSADEDFVERAISLVEKNIDQPDFNVDQFAREMAVSRAFLFAKLKAVTKLTPNNFVKKIRLKRAAQLIREYDLEVSQVAYKVGFRDPRYFSKCFRKIYHVNPSEYTGSNEKEANENLG